MYKSIVFVCGVLALTGCGGEQEKLPNPSAAQEQAASVAYEDLRDRKYDDFLNHLSPELQTQFRENEKLMRKFSSNIPKDTYKSKTLMTKKMEKTAQGIQYKVSYEIAYPQNLVQYDVSFDRAGGGTEIKNFNIRVFGES